MDRLSCCKQQNLRCQERVLKYLNRNTGAARDIMFFLAHFLTLNHEHRSEDYYLLLLLLVMDVLRLAMTLYGSTFTLGVCNTKRRTSDERIATQHKRENSAFITWIENIKAPHYSPQIIRLSLCLNDACKRD